MLLFVACAAGQLSAATETRFTIVDSSPTSWIGLGYHNYTVTPALGWTFQQLFPGCNCFADFKISGPQLPGTVDTNWRIMLYSPDGDLRPKIYPDFQRFPFQDDGRPGVSFAGTNRLDNTASRSFEVLEATFGAGGMLQSFAVNITHYGETNSANYTIAELRYNATVPEPTAILLFAVGIVLLSAPRRRKPASHNRV